MKRRVDTGPPEKGLEGQDKELVPLSCAHTLSRLISDGVKLVWRHTAVLAYCLGEAHQKPIYFFLMKSFPNLFDYESIDFVGIPINFKVIY